MFLAWRLLSGTSWKSRKLKTRTHCYCFNLFTGICFTEWCILSDSVVMHECEWAKQCMWRRTPCCPLWFSLLMSVTVSSSVTQFSELVHQIILIFCMKLVVNKGKKVTAQFFNKNPIANIGPQYWKFKQSSWYSSKYKSFSVLENLGIEVWINLCS